VAVSQSESLTLEPARSGAKQAVTHQGDETYKRGRVMPRTDTIMKWLINKGARLQFEYVLDADMTYVGSEELYVVDLASADELEDDVSNVGAADLAATEDAQKP
jgi:hypothetical protein